MSITNTSKPSTSFTNASRVTSTLTNASEPTFVPLWSTSVLPWQLDTPWLRFGEITNSTRAT